MKKSHKVENTTRVKKQQDSKNTTKEKKFQAVECTRYLLRKPECI